MTKHNLKTAISAALLGAAFAAPSIAFAQSGDQEDMLQMKSDANIENRSADKAAIFNNTETDSASGYNEGNDYSASSQTNEQEYSQEPSAATNNNTQAASQNIDVTEDQTLHFQFDSTQLTSESQQKLQNIKQQLSERDTAATVEIVGYTDTSGPEVYNQYLSEERAKAIKSELEDVNIQVQDWEVKGEGEANPIADNDSREGRQENRRVELIISMEGEALTSADRF